MRFSALLPRLYATSVAILSLAAAKSGPTNVAYIEVNTNSLLNVGKYVLTDGSNAFDIAVIFAANINWNGTAAVLYNNPQVQALLGNASTQIAPLQKKGIKVLLSILGNHQGAGFANFQSQAAATAFATQVRNEVVKYNLDGVDLDDEYADYGTNGLPQPNNRSIGWLISALRTDMPKKLITFYDIGPSGEYLSSDPPSIGAKLNYAWNPYYGSYSPPTVPGLNKSQLAAAAIDIGSDSASTAYSFAKQTVSDGYGAYVSYDLTAGNYSSYVSNITLGLYGLKAKYTG